ncbi:unnamed protein product [Ceratitis capitata]|uniref:(Mediterranean fruit fly) hypothetical protein n=1 Tax=Ceratitis capitata TaxID=7213 RepID=A0A811V3T1_CERCA|nr:unnamed protein product [Ceratitis capitata]
MNHPTSWEVNLSDNSNCVINLILREVGEKPKLKVDELISFCSSSSTISAVQEAEVNYTSWTIDLSNKIESKKM